MQVSDVSSSVKIVPLHREFHRKCSLCLSLSKGKGLVTKVPFLEEHKKVELFAENILQKMQKEICGGFVQIKLSSILNTQYQMLEECFKKKNFEWISVDADGIQVKITWTYGNRCLYDPRITDLLKLEDFNQVYRDQKLFERYLKKIDCDFTIISAEREEIRVHKCVIRAHSKWIDKALNQDCLESKNSVITYPTASTKVIRAFVKYLYTKNILEANQTDSRSSYTTEELLDIFSFSDYLGKRKLSIMSIHHIDRSSTLEEKQELLSNIHSYAHPARFENQVFVTTMLFWANTYDSMLGCFAKGIHGCDKDSYTLMQGVAEKYSLNKVKVILNAHMR